eukprot:430812_1
MTLPTLRMSALSSRVENEKALFASASEKNNSTLCYDIDLEDEITSNYNDDDISFTELLLTMQQINEDVICAEKGYKRICKISDTLQGEMYKAEVTNLYKGNIAKVGDFVAIKKTDRSLHSQKIAIQDDMHFCVSEDITNEAAILEMLTADTDISYPGSQHIIQYVDFFESDSYFYLVIEYINGITLEQFIIHSHKMIKNDKLSSIEYSKTIKYIMWQLVVTLHSLHNTFNLCHLDLCSENIMVQNAAYIEMKDNTLKSNPKMQIYLIDFGVSETFPNGKFECFKQGLSLQNEIFVAPQICNNRKYDPRAADVWAIGQMFYKCIIGQVLYEPEDMWDQPRKAYLALVCDELKQYLKVNNLMKYFKGQSVYLLQQLLQMEESNRLNVKEIMQHQWFNCYYRRENATDI